MEALFVVFVVVMMERHPKKFWHKAFILALIIGFFFMGIFIIWAASLTAPDLESFDQRKVEQTTKIYDRTGEILLYEMNQDVSRTLAPYESISRHIKNATVAIEDTEFYNHNGIRPLATFRAVFIQPLRGLGVQGGSTITQQVVKNSLLTNERAVSRKFKEWALALKLEQVYSKEEILTFYLNETPYGGNIYGITEATNRFFGKTPEEVTLAEAAYLAALPQAPTFYSPYGNNTDRLDERKNLVLSQMLKNDFITEKEYEEAREEEVSFEKPRDTGILAPHFVFFVQEQLEQKYGKRALEEEGYRIITSLDYDLQQKAEEIVNRYALTNTDNFNAENASLVAIDPETGEVLVMVGSRDYFDEEIDGNFNVAIQANRQPGSSFKPFVYAQALREGYTPETVVFDLETQFQTTCEPDDFSDDGDCYTPGNYDFTFRGPVTFREALAQSINIPAIKALYLAGLQDSLRLSQRMGIGSLVDVNQYGLTLVLGGGEVSLFDITSAYSVFANEGVRNDPIPILRVEDADGNVLEEFRPTERRVLEENVALQISDILSDNEARTPAFGAFSPLYFPGYDVAAKTGTTNESRDAWIVGYTPTIAVGAWAGNNDNRPMVKQVAGFIIAPLWNEFMKEALAIRPNKSFKDPLLERNVELKPVLKGEWRGGIEYTIDSLSGNLATIHTPKETREAKVVTNIQPILYWVSKNDPLGPIPENPEKDPQFKFWEYSVAQWAEENGYEQEDESVIPTSVDNLHSPDNAPKITVHSPQPNQSFSGSDLITVSLSHFGNYGISKINFFVDGILISTATTPPYTISFIPNDKGITSGQKTLRIAAYDSVLNETVVQIPFQIR